MNVPISYVPGFVTDPGTEFTKLWNELEWERRGSTPRREYYCNTEPVPYGYGVHAGYREYLPRAWHPSVVAIRTKVEDFLATELGVVFLNGYENSKDSLGWHADDSKEMDDAKPIAIVTLGAEREIWFRPNSNTDDITRLKLESGSICVMAPGMQDAFMHRIPRAGFDCGPRISLTLRGYVAP